MPLDNNNIPYCITEARTRLIVKHVFFSVILYEQCQLVVVADSDDLWRGMPVPTACTDGKHIVINLEFFESLQLEERVFVLAHEVYHAMALHPRRMAYYRINGLFGHVFYGSMYNIAADAVINQCLVTDKIGRMPKQGVLFPNGIRRKDGSVYTITGQETPEVVYEIMLETAKKMPPPPGGGSGDGPGGPGGPGDGQQIIDDNRGQGEADTDLVEADTQTASQINEEEMRAAIQSAANQAKARGTLPAGLQAFIDEFLEPQVNWEEQLRTAIVMRSNPETFDWNKANRRQLLRGLYMPRRVGRTCGPVAIGIDTSGSVSNEELSAFMGESSAILSDVNPEKVYVIWCDAVVERVDELDSAEDLLQLTKAEGIPGRGGTAFSPVFEHVRDNIDDEVAFIIYMTDGHAPFPEAELQDIAPTIWVMSTDVEAPFGTNIHLDISGRQ